MGYLNFVAGLHDFLVVAVRAEQRRAAMCSGDRPAFARKPVLHMCYTCPWWLLASFETTRLESCVGCRRAFSAMSSTVATMPAP